MRNGLAYFCPPLIPPSRHLMKPYTARGVASPSRIKSQRRFVRFPLAAYAGEALELVGHHPPELIE
jgi:hypothetical protein